MTQPVNVFLAYGSSDTVEVTLTSWDRSAENGVGTLADGTEVTVFTSYDGDGFLQLSDQDTERYQERYRDRDMLTPLDLNKCVQAVSNNDELESEEERLERQALEHLEAIARHRDDPMF